MKTKFTILFLAVSFGINAQSIFNPGFENWAPQSYADTMPNQWWSLYCMTVTKTTDAYQGNYASKIAGVLMCGIAPGVMINGPQPASGNIIDGGTPFAVKPNVVQGYYKFTDVQAGDSAEITIILKKFNTITLQRDTVAMGILTLPASANYSLFTVSINDLMPNVNPDSIIMIFNSSKYNLIDWNVGTLPNLYVDAIKLEETTSGIVENQSLNNATLFPNPFFQTATLVIDADLSEMKELTLQVYDAQGKLVFIIEHITDNSIAINRNNLAAGNYYYRLKNNTSLIAAGKMSVQ